jgi:hypothetical protein
MLTETQLQNSILEFLNSHSSVDIAIPYKQLKANKKTRRSKWQPKGIPDIIGCMKNGITLWVEVKLEKGTISPEQEAFIESRLKRNQVAFFARSIMDCHLALASFGY